MKAAAGTFGRKTMIWSLVGAGLMLLAAANWHLVYVSTVSQPDCVPHLRQAGAQANEFRAAVSSCAVK